MKLPNRFPYASLIACTSGFLALTGFASLQAAELFWNAGGDGVWGTGPGDKNWNPVNGAPMGNIAWQDDIDDVAVFNATTGGTVTVFDTVQTAGIRQNGASYTINAGTIILAPDSAANAPFVNVQNGTLTIDSELDGSSGMVKSGNSTLILTSASSYSGLTAIQAGTLNLAGSLASTNLSISSGAILLNQNGGLSSTATLTNAGSLTLTNPDTIASYISHGGTLTNGAGTLFTTSAALNGGSTLAGQLNTTTLTSDGTVLLSGTATAGSASIQSGTLTLSGTMVSDSVSISSGAALLNQNGGLSSTATLTNAGSLTLTNQDTIASYISNGGALTNGAGTLFTTSAVLSNGSTIAGQLNTTTLTSDGTVSVSGTATAESININTGALTNTGTLGTLTAQLNINQAASLTASGIQRYALLTTSGAGAGTWVGDLTNTSRIAPGGIGSVGILAVNGNFTQSASGTLLFDLSATASDRLDVTGSATFGGALQLNQLGIPIAPFVPITVVDAGSYAGNFTSFSENLDGAVLFNPGNGTVTRLQSPAGNGSNLYGATRNQTSTWISLYDDVIDPSVPNIISGPSAYEITSGIADVNNPDLLWALSESFTPTGLNAELLNRLSPEVYGSFSDYAIVATRAHQRSALSAPSLTKNQDNQSAKSGLTSNAKSGMADALEPLALEFFAAVDYFNAGTENSINQADYDFEGAGILAGVRTMVHEQTQLGLYFGFDSGSSQGALINSDTFGWNLGIITQTMLEEKSQTRLTTAVSFGNYEFDGTRRSVSATSGGWMPDNVNFDDVMVESLDLFVGIDSVLWNKNHVTIIPSAGLRYSQSSMDAFIEQTGSAPGSAIALSVDQDLHEVMLLELGVLARWQADEKLTLLAEGGINFGLLESGRVLSASFVNGDRSLRAEAQGLNNDSLYIGLGALYQISDNIRAGFNYRADFRSGAEAQQELRFSSSWQF